MKLYGIFAHTVNDIFAADGALPWPHKIKEDMDFFRSTTMHHPIIMGRGTWLSFDCKPLPGRLNVVVSSYYGNIGKSADNDNVVYFATFDEACKYLKNANYDECYVIGGARMFNEVYMKIDEWFVTVVNYYNVYSNVVRSNMYWLSRPGMALKASSFVWTNGNVDGIDWIKFEHYAYDPYKDYSLGLWGRIKRFFKR